MRRIEGTALDFVQQRVQFSKLDYLVFFLKQRAISIHTSTMIYDDGADTWYRTTRPDVLETA